MDLTFSIIKRLIQSRTGAQHQQNGNLTYIFPKQFKGCVHPKGIQCRRPKEEMETLGCLPACHHGLGDPWRRLQLLPAAIPTPSFLLLLGEGGPMESSSSRCPPLPYSFSTSCLHLCKQFLLKSLNTQK
jgi:hypothetical protein